MRERARQLSRLNSVQLPVRRITRQLSLVGIALLLGSALLYLRHHPRRELVAIAAPVTAPVSAPSGAVTPARAWPTFHGNFQRSGSIDGIDGPGAAKILWTFRETEGPPSDFSASAAVVGGRVYVASANVDVVSRSGYVYCFDAQTGQK